MKDMEIIPAIDLRGGKCVRLYQGDYDQETIFSDDPVGIALKWQSQDAPRLHLVDLDGARGGELCHIEVIGRMVEAIHIPLELGGGIRELRVVEQLLRLGIQRVILGTGAAEDIELVEEACSRFGEAIVIGIDAREGCVRTRGWRRKTDITPIELGYQMEALGAKRFIYTDIARDGTLTGPNFESIAELVHHISLPIIASGGISSIAHLVQLYQLGVEGAVVGRALYTGDIDLKGALKAIKQCRYGGTLPD
jgi:phosphoribosylformimino-5-aminoimidazole carboxamide ribotide isomerase